MKGAPVDLIATATFGLESVVAHEVRALGYGDASVENGRVLFRAEAAAIPRANLWLRAAERVLVRVGSFAATDFGELFEKTKALPWEAWLSEDARFPVNGKSVRSGLFSVPDCQSIVKKAIVERLKTRYGREWFTEDGPLFTVEVGLLDDVATLTIDTSGAGLHKRGYRDLSAPAPMKETLAAGMILLSRWFHDRPLLDPFAGSGTIPIEAALIARNAAPGMRRAFAAEQWPAVPKQLWARARQEVEDLLESERTLRIEGSDADASVLSLARRHAERAGVGGHVRFVRRALGDLSSVADYGWVICNPPYGERLGDEAEVERLYAEMGEVSRRMPTWSWYVLTSHPRFERLFGRKADRRRKLYNGRIECQLHQYVGPRPPRRRDTATEDRSSVKGSA